MLLVIGFLVLTVDHLTPYQSAKQGIKESHFEIKMSKREMSLFSVQTPFFTSFVIVHERDARGENPFQAPNGNPLANFIFPAR